MIFPFLYDDLRPFQKASGDDVAKQLAILENNFWDSSSITGLDCTNNKITGTTIPTFLKSVRDPISGMTA